NKSSTEVILVDFDESFEETIEKNPLSQKITHITDKNDAKEIVVGIVGYIKLLKKKEIGVPMTLIISNLSDFILKTNLKAEDFVLALKASSKVGLNFIIFTPHEYIAKSFEEIAKLIRPLKFSGLIGARVYDSPLLKGQTYSQEPELQLYEAFYTIKGGAVYEQIKLPKESGASDV
ncbi:hypothetical protein, partial [Pseudolactococcus yaeyamensis]